MPQKVVTGDDGKQYVEMPTGFRVPVEDFQAADAPARDPLQGQGSPEFRKRWMDMRAKLNIDETGRDKLAENPEVLAALVPGAGIAAPALVGAGASVVRDLSHGERNPMELAGGAVLHGGLNAIPGLAGVGTKVAQVLSRVPKGTFPNAAIEGASAPSWTGAIIKTLGEVMKGAQKAPAAGTQILPGTGGLSARGVNAVQVKNVVDSLRAILGLGSATTGS